MTTLRSAPLIGMSARVGCDGTSSPKCRGAWSGNASARDRFQCQRHDRTGVLFHGFTAVTAKIIRCCIACGDVDQSQLLIRAGQAPRSAFLACRSHLRRKADGSSRPMSQAHFSAPVTGSKPRTTPDGSPVSWLSRTQPPKTRVSLATVGGEVTK